ncbi:hypothetical protein ACV2ZF_32225, partial [Escherichia coli]
LPARSKQSAAFNIPEKANIKNVRAIRFISSLRAPCRKYVNPSHAQTQLICTPHHQKFHTPRKIKILLIGSLNHAVREKVM